MLNQRLRHLSRRSTREKLLAYLHDQARLRHSNRFEIPFDRQALADYLGVERSAMSAELGKLRREGLLLTKRRYFELLQPVGESLPPSGRSDQRNRRMGRY